MPLFEQAPWMVSYPYCLWPARVAMSQWSFPFLIILVLALIVPPAAYAGSANANEKMSIDMIIIMDIL
jgi:hypothetical protein